MHPLDARQLRAILDRLYVMDCQASCTTTSRPRTYWSMAIVWGSSTSSSPGSWIPQYLRAGNCGFLRRFQRFRQSFLPARSNVANFEFRAFHRYLLELCTVQSAAAANALLRDWLRGKSAYHRRMADFLRNSPKRQSSELPSLAGLQQTRLAKCCSRQQRTRVYSRSCLSTRPMLWFGLKRSLMAFRCAVFERHATEAKRLQHATLAEISQDATHAMHYPTLTGWPRRGY